MRFVLLVLLAAQTAFAFTKLTDAIAYYEQCVDPQTGKEYNSDGDSICDTFVTTEDYAVFEAALSSPADYTSAEHYRDEYGSEAYVAAFLANQQTPDYSLSNYASLYDDLQGVATDESSTESEVVASTEQASTPPGPTSKLLETEEHTSASVADGLLALRHHHHKRRHHHKNGDESLEDHYRRHHPMESFEELQREGSEGALPFFKDLTKRWPAASVKYSVITASGQTGGTNKVNIAPFDQTALPDLMTGFGWWSDETCATFDVVAEGTMTSNVVLISGPAYQQWKDDGICASSGRGNSNTDEEVLWLSSSAKAAEFTLTIAGGAAFTYTLTWTFPKSPDQGVLAPFSRTTALIQSTATAVQIATAFAPLQVTVTGADSPFTVKFDKDYAKNHNILLVSSKPLTATVAQTVVGGGWQWETGCPRGTYAHEMGHSTGFGHPMQRDDFTDYFTYNTAPKDYSLDNQFKKLDSSWSSSAFPNYDDPRKARETLAKSVMMYGFGTTCVKWDQSVSDLTISSIDKLKGQRTHIDVLDTYMMNLYYQCLPVFLDSSSKIQWVHPLQPLKILKKKLATKYHVRPQDAFFRLVPNDVQSFAFPANTKEAADSTFAITTFSSATDTLGSGTKDILWTPNTELLVLRVQAALDQWSSGTMWAHSGQTRKIEKLDIAGGTVTATITGHGVTGTPTLRFYGEKKASANALLYTGLFAVTVVDANTLSYTITTTPTAIASDTQVTCSLDPTIYVTTYSLSRYRLNPTPLKLMTIDTTKTKITSGSAVAITAVQVQAGAPVVEIDTLTLAGATQGQYQLQIGDPTVSFFAVTEKLPFNADRYAIQSALGATSGFLSVTVDGNTGGPFTISLWGTVGAQTDAKIRVIEVAPASMQGKVPTIAQKQVGKPMVFPTDDTATLTSLLLKQHSEFSLQWMPAKSTSNYAVNLPTAGDKTVAGNSDWTVAEFLAVLKVQFPTETINKIQLVTDSSTLPPSQTLFSAGVYSWVKLKAVA